MTDLYQKRRRRLALLCLGLDLSLLAPLLTGAWLVLDGSSYSCSSPHRDARRELDHLQWAAEVYRITQGRGPSSLDDLVDAELIAKAQADPWGNPYVLVCPYPDHPCGVLSAGPDGVAGTADDLRRWAD